MQAAVLHSNSDLRVERVETPSPGAGEIRLKVAFCGVCGSDIPRLVKDGAHYYPIILGHEFSGVIDAVGKGVDTGLMGRKAACAPLIPNFQDPECAKGHYSLGKGYDFIGSRKQGGFAEYVVMPVGNAVLVDDAVDLLAVSFLEAITVGLHAVNLMHLPVGRPMAITGAGGIGLLLLQSLKQLGAGRITALDVAPGQLKLARKLGADFCINSGPESGLEEALADITGRGFDAVFESSGAPPAEKLALQLAAPKGQVMFIGTPHTPLTLKPAEFELINRKELTIQGSWMNYSAPFPGWEWRFGAELLAQDRIQVRELIGKVVPLSAAAEIPDLLNGPNSVQGKIVLDCTA